MLIYRTNDADLINQVLTDPSLYGRIRDDQSPDPEDFDISAAAESEANYFFIAEVNGEVAGLLFFHPLNGVTYQVHIATLPKYRSKTAYKFQKHVVDYMFETTLCKKIVSFIPEEFEDALRFSLGCGFYKEAVLSKAIERDGKLQDVTIVSKDRGQ